MVPKPCRFVLFLIVLFASILSVRPLWAGNDWQPVTPEDLKATAPPEAAGADAIILYRQADYDDQTSVAAHYYRIKVLTEEGKKRADVQIPFLKGREDVRDVKARTIHPDGSIVEFDGKVYEKTVVKAGNVRVITKSFTLPAVTPGSIIEYRYKESWDVFSYYAPDWIVQEDLFVRKAHFSMKPANTTPIAWVWAALPEGVAPKEKGGLILLDMENIPAFVDEEYTPPDRELKSRVEFYYLFDRSVDTKKMDQFWKEWGKRRNGQFESFIGHRGAIAALAATLVSPSDTIQRKLKKLYDRVQQLRNTSFEPRKTDQELKRENRKDNNNVEDVLKHGYGDREDITLLFIALARAAGIESHAVLVPERDDRFFHETVPNVWQFNSVVAAVKLPAGTALLDPGTPYCPFGMLAWYKTAVRALELDKNGGTFIVTNAPQAKQAVRLRTADLTLDDEGMLHGTATLSYAGYYALNHRLERMQTDEAGWKKEFEDLIKGWLPSGAKITLESIEGATDGGAPLSIHYKVEMPGVLSATGKRLFLPTTFFQVDHPFRHADRKYPVYFAYPFEDIDEVNIHLPPDIQVDSLPAAHQVAPEFASYSVQRVAQGTVLVLKRQLSMNGFYFKTDQYKDLRSFYDTVSNDDDEQVVAKHVPTKGL